MLPKGQQQGHFMPCKVNCQRRSNAAVRFQFDTMPRPCYYSAIMNTVDSFELTYSYLGGGYAPTPAG